MSEEKKKEMGEMMSRRISGSASPSMTSDAQLTAAVVPNQPISCLQTMQQQAQSTRTLGYKRRQHHPSSSHLSSVTRRSVNKLFSPASPLLAACGVL